MSYRVADINSRVRDVTKCSVWTAASLLAVVLLLSAGSPPALATVTEVKPLSLDPPVGTAIRPACGEE